MWFQLIGQVCYQVGRDRNILDTCLGALYLDLKTKGIFWTRIFWLAANCIFFHIQSSCLQLMGLRFPRLVGCLFLLISLIAKTCEMAKLVASLALELFGSTLESLYVSRVTTLGASIFILVHRFGVKISLGLVWCWVLCILVIRLPLLNHWFLLLILPDGSSVHWWCMRLIWAAWGSPATCLICLAVALNFPFSL